MSISQHDAIRLRQAGFLEHEIQELANAKTVDGKDQPPINLDAAAWQAVLKSRSEWWTDKVDRGWSEDEITNELSNYYKRDRKRTPFDFLRAEYKPPRKADYISIIRKRHEQEIKEELEGYFRK